MKNVYLLAIAFLFAFGVKAAPGDTTWVQANDVRLDYYNNFDTTVRFPDGSKNTGRSSWSLHWVNTPVPDMILKIPVISRSDRLVQRLGLYCSDLFDE